MCVSAIMFIDRLAAPGSRNVRKFVIGGKFRHRLWRGVSLRVSIKSNPIANLRHIREDSTMTSLKTQVSCAIFMTCSSFRTPVVT